MMSGKIQVNTSLKCAYNSRGHQINWHQIVVVLDCFLATNFTRMFSPNFTWKFMIFNEDESPSNSMGTRTTLPGKILSTFCQQHHQYLTTRHGTTSNIS